MLCTPRSATTRTMKYAHGPVFLSPPEIFFPNCLPFYYTNDLLLMLLHHAGGERDNGRRRSSGGREDPKHVKLRAVKQMLAEVRPRAVTRRRVPNSPQEYAYGETIGRCHLNYCHVARYTYIHILKHGGPHVHVCGTQARNGVTSVPPFRSLSVRVSLSICCSLNTAAMTQQYTPFPRRASRSRTQAESILAGDSNGDLD